MQLHPLDVAVLGLYAVLSAAIALWFARRGTGSHSGDEYMVAGRRLPWWVVGIADVATADGADAFWIFVFFVGAFQGYHRFFWISAIIGMPIGVLWARYWRRLHLSSPGQLIEERYGGRAAALLRALSSGYSAFVVNGILLGYVMRGFAQSLRPFLGWPEDLVLLVFCGTALLYTLLAGLVAVAYTDIAHFALMMIGRLILAYILLSAEGGLTSVLDRVEAIRGAQFLAPYPPSPAGADFGEFRIEPLSLLALCLMGILSGAGGQGAGAQKSLAAKDERHAALGQVWAAALSLVLRVVPLLVIGLCAVALLAPDRRDTDLWADLVHKYVPPGLLGLLLCGIISGYVSTIDGLVNFGAAGLLNDVYRRHLRPGASERAQVAFGRLASIAVMAVAYLWARVLIARVDGAWINFINSVAGLCMLPLALLRWLWWRTTIAAEIGGFLLSFPLAYLVWFVWPMKDRPYWQAFLVLGGLGTLLVVLVSLLSRPASPQVLRSFYERVRPPGLWGAVRAGAPLPGHGAELHRDLVTALVGIALSASLAFGLASLFSRQLGLAAVLAATAALTGAAYVRLLLKGT